MAARLLSDEGKTGRAAAAIETAWKAAPHPALWLAYRDLKTAETPKERAKRLTNLAAQNPGHRESRILVTEAALIDGDAATARGAASALDEEPMAASASPSLKARVAFALGQPDERRRNASAPGHERAAGDGLVRPRSRRPRLPAYQAADWARLVSTFAETGELIHPRFERREALAQASCPSCRSPMQTPRRSWGRRPRTPALSGR